MPSLMSTSLQSVLGAFYWHQHCVGVGSPSNFQDKDHSAERGSRTEGNDFMLSERSEYYGGTSWCLAIEEILG